MDTAPSKRGRPRAFDEDQVLEAALGAFWERGYEATSLATLMEATGLAKASLYGAFGSKRELYLRAVDRYLERAHEGLRDELESAESALAGLRAYFDRLIAACDQGGGRGCFKINAQVEHACHDAELRERFDKDDALRAELLAGLLERGQREGTVRTDQSPADQAHFLSVFVAGLFAQVRAGLDGSQVRTLVDTALAGVTSV